MSYSEKIKAFITKEITHFLVQEHTKPTGIEIKISYPQSNAYLHIEADQIAKALEEEKEV